jgi:hypothetical protein
MQTFWFSAPTGYIVDWIICSSARTPKKTLRGAEYPTLTVGAHVLSGFNIEEHLKEIIYFSDFTPEATAAAPLALFLGTEF